MKVVIILSENNKINIKEMAENTEYRNYYLLGKAEIIAKILLQNPYTTNLSDLQSKLRREIANNDDLRNLIYKLTEQNPG